MSEYWDTYMGFIDENLASVVIDMGVWEEVNTKDYNYATAVRIIIKEPFEDGFPNEKEADVLDDMEEILSEFAEKNDVIHVARVTTEGIRDIIFYSKTSEPAELIKVAEEVCAAKNYQFELVGIEEEENWEFYFDFLYPNQYQQQHMGNRDLVERLEQEGDLLEKKRPVTHFLQFTSKRLLKKFIKDVKKEGFSIDEESIELNDEGYYGLSIERADAVDYFLINEVTDLLIEIAEKYEGEYDGWETFVVNR